MLGYAKQNAYDISHLSGVFDEILKLRTFGKQIEFKICFRALSNKLYHSGIRCAISKSALAKANELRNSSIYFDFAQTLILEARSLYVKTDPLIAEINLMAYALDSTTIDLCLSLFPWAKFRKAKGAIKLHTLLDLNGLIPTFIDITNGSTHDVNALATI